MAIRKVTEAALVARVRRALLNDGTFLKKPRSEMEQHYLGHYILENAHTGNLECWTSDLESLARQCGVLRPNEVVSE